MYFVEPIVCLFAICYLSMYVYSLFANIILLGTIYLLKFLRSFFLQHNSYPGIIFFAIFFFYRSVGFVARLKSRSRVAPPPPPQKLFFTVRSCVVHSCFLPDFSTMKYNRTWVDISYFNKE